MAAMLRVIYIIKNALSVRLSVRPSAATLRAQKPTCLAASVASYVASGGQARLCA